jgi:hypothetical protein
MINVDIQSGVLDHADCSSEARSKSIEKSASDGGLCMSEQRAGHGQQQACVHPARSQLLGSSATRDVIFIFLEARSFSEKFSISIYEPPPSPLFAIR